AAKDAAEAGDGQSGPLAIDGTEGMIVSYARCCFPLPGDLIMGHLSAGRGIVVHRDCCGNLGEFRKQPDKWLSVDWRDEIDREFTAEIRVEVFNRLGVLAAVAAKIAETETNIEHVSVVERDGDTSSLTFQLQLTALEHYGRVVKSISSMPDVLSVNRTCA
ncbi:MAG: ACT domain-containing protein, partial [Pseudomonadota bacterium]